MFYLWWIGLYLEEEILSLDKFIDYPKIESSSPDSAGWGIVVEGIPLKGSFTSYDSAYRYALSHKYTDFKVVRK